MYVRSGCLLAVTILAAAPTRGAAAEERITLFDLVTSAPLPKGYEAKRRDFEKAGGLGSTLIVLTTPANKSRVSITLEHKMLIGKVQKVAAFKSYVNGIHALFTKMGYKTVEIEFPDQETLDPSKRLDLRLWMKKEDESLYVDAEVLFTEQGYTVWSIAYDETQRELLMAWTATVRPK